MKKALFLFFCLSGLIFKASSQHSLTWAWASDTALQVPESVLFDPQDKVLWVSCIDGVPTEADGKGAIVQLRHDGRIIDREWITGLNAPKGLARSGKYLYVADLTEVVVIDIPGRKIEKKIPVEGAKFLNDVTIDPSGTVYVSDSQTGKIHSIKDGTVTTHLENLVNPNGVWAKEGTLYFLANGALYKAGAEKPVKLAEGMDPSTDGLEQVKQGEFVVSAWSGVVYYVTDKGKVTQMLDTRRRKSNTADISYDPATHTVFVPTFFKKGVVGYTLK